MIEILRWILKVDIVVFAVFSMCFVGLNHTIQEVVSPLKVPRKVINAVLANFILVPLYVFLILQIIPLERSYSIGFMLVALAAGAPSLIKLTITAGENVARSTALLILLLPVTIVYMPLLIPVIIPGVDVSARVIATPLIVTMLIPLIIGFLIKAFLPKIIHRIKPIFRVVPTITLVLLIVLTFIVNFRSIIDILGNRVIVTAVIVILGAFGIGYLLGWPDITSRNILGLGTAQRNIAAATVAATQAFTDSDILVVVVLTSLVGLLLLFPIAKILRKIEERYYEAHPDHIKGK